METPILPSFCRPNPARRQDLDHTAQEVLRNAQARGDSTWLSGQITAERHHRKVTLVLFHCA